MLKIKFLVIAIAISFAGILSSCYYDYGIDPNDSNIVVTLYDNTYPFSNVTKYILDTTVNKIGNASITSAYDNLIINTQPGMMRQAYGKDLSDRERDIKRAKIIRGIF